MTKLVERRQLDRVAQKDIIVLYHANCSDGFGGAWAVWKKFGDSAEYFPVFHKASPPEGLIDKTIYTVDFVYPEEITEKLIKDNKLVTAIDHHITNEKVARMTKDYLFDINYSGAGLAWKYFHPDKKLPVLLEYVQATDLWKFYLPDQREIFAALDLYEFNFKVWDKLAEELEDPEKRKKYIEKGKIVTQFTDIMVKRLSNKLSQKVEFEGVTTYAVNSPEFISEIGYRLYTEFPPIAIIWYKRRDDKTVVSLRSDGSVDVGELAVKHGGGGHKKSSGFTLEPGESLPWKILEDDQI